MKNLNTTELVIKITINLSKTYCYGFGFNVYFLLYSVVLGVLVCHALLYPYGLCSFPMIACLALISCTCVLLPSSVVCVYLVLCSVCFLVASWFYLCTFIPAIFWRFS